MQFSQGTRKYHRINSIKIYSLIPLCFSVHHFKTSVSSTLLSELVYCDFVDCASEIPAAFLQWWSVLAELSVCLSWLRGALVAACAPARLRWAEAALRLCCLRASPQWLLVAERGLRPVGQQSSTGAPSPCLQALGPQASVAAVGAGAQAQEWWCAASLLCRVGSSWTRGHTCIPRVGRWLLSTALPGKSPVLCFFKTSRV